MLSDAPCSINAAITSRVFLSLILVVNLPSEKVPAPPSPKQTLFSEESIPSSFNLSKANTRSCISLPRSIINGRYPLFASVYAQNSPHGPDPTITGRPFMALFPSFTCSSFISTTCSNFFKAVLHSSASISTE